MVSLLHWSDNQAYFTTIRINFGPFDLGVTGRPLTPSAEIAVVSKRTSLFREPISDTADYELL